jgi:hypothetical protein
MTNQPKRSVFHPKYSSLQYFASFCARLTKDIFSYRFQHKSYRDIVFSFTKLHHQQHSFFSFVVNGKHIVVWNGTNPRDPLILTLSLTLSLHYPFNRSQASSDGPLEILSHKSSDFAWCRSSWASLQWHYAIRMEETDQDSPVWPWESRRIRAKTVCTIYVGSWHS